MTRTPYYLPVGCCVFQAFGCGVRKEKTAPKTALIQRICRAVEMPHWSAAQPTNGEHKPPIVVLSPSVTPEARPIFLLRKVCPKITIGLYAANKEKATGRSNNVDSQMLVLLTKINIAGTMRHIEPRITLRKPKRSDKSPPINVMTTPMEKRMDKARLPCDGEACST